MNVNFSIPVSLFNYRESENSLYSFAKLKIFYVGQTKDKRIFTKEFSDQLLSTLPYVPVVGYYDDESEDFIGHYAPEQHIYGVVPEDTLIEYIWEGGKQYAVCDVILYTGRLDKTGEIAQKIVGKQHSLELNPEDTTYEIRKDNEGRIQNIEFKTGSLLGLSILGDNETPAFGGSSFFTQATSTFTEDLRNSMNELYQQEVVLSNFKTQYSRNSYENRKERVYDALKIRYSDTQFEIKEMTDLFVHYTRYYYDQNGERTITERLYYQDFGTSLDLIGSPERVSLMYLTDEEIDILEWHEISETIDWYTDVEGLDMRPNDAIIENVKKGLELCKKNKKFLTDAHISRVQNIINHKNLSVEVVQKMYQYFTRHKNLTWEENIEKQPSNDFITWLLWGGDAGYSWAKEKLDQLKNTQKLNHENVEVKLVEKENLQEEVVETKDETLESTENPQIMEEEAEVVETNHIEEEEEKEEETTEEMEENEEEEEEVEDMEEKEEEKEEEMEEEEEEEEMEEKEEEKDKEDYSGTNYEEGEQIEEQTQSAQIEGQEESGSAALNSSERAELEAFRREKKAGLIDSFEDDLSKEFLADLHNKINDYSIDELEVILSKEYTRINRENKKTKPNAFIYKTDTRSAATSEAEVVKRLVQKYK